MEFRSWTSPYDWFHSAFSDRQSRVVTWVQGKIRGRGGGAGPLPLTSLSWKRRWECWGCNSRRRRRPILRDWIVC